MNNKILYIFIFVVASLGIFNSCSENFLNVDSKTSLTDQNFYKTEADAEMALIGCYDGYQGTTSKGGFSFYVASEVMSDDCFGGTGNADGRNHQVVDRFDKAQSNSDNNIFNDTWTFYYAAIFRCNTLLEKLPTISSWKSSDADVVTTTRNRIEGETRFLRALMYFDMVRLFENIPLLKVATTDNVPQAAPVETYKLIVEDLKFAAQNIPAEAYPKAKSAENDGRATQYAAKALLARVYLFYTGYYGKEDIGVSKAEALAGLEDVIKSNEYELLVNFNALWPAASYVPNVADNTLNKSGFAGKGNKEVIFAQKFNNTQDYNGNLDGNRWLVMIGMRSTNFSPYGKGWGACTVNPATVAAFASNDKRKAASVIDLKNEGIESIFDLKDQREYTGYTVKKYSPTALPDGNSDTGGSKDFQISQDQDFTVIRYADVLLMVAELGSTSAQSYMDLVRSRSGLTSVSATKENILAERHFEFAFEAIRYWDLLRQGLTVAANAIAQSQNTLSGGANDLVVIAKDNVLKTKGFMQIPNTQITLSNGVLKQNAGW